MNLTRLLIFAPLMLLPNAARAQHPPKTFHLDEATISDVQDAYKSGALTSVKLVQAYLRRIRACDQAGPKLNVVITLNPRALQEAAALDEHFRKTGKFVGPLHGIPVLLKDNVNTSDMPTTAGSLSLAGFIPAADARPRIFCRATKLV
jgi:amidase